MVPVRVDMSRAILDGADLTRANLIHVVLTYGKLRNTKLVMRAWTGPIFRARTSKAPTWRAPISPMPISRARHWRGSRAPIRARPFRHKVSRNDHGDAATNYRDGNIGPEILRKTGTAARGLGARLLARPLCGKGRIHLPADRCGLAVAIAAGWSWFLGGGTTRPSRSCSPGTSRDRSRHRVAQVLFARAYYLLKHSRVEEAQAVLDQASWRGDEGPACRCSTTWRTGVFSRFSTPSSRANSTRPRLDRLAKGDYTEALRLDPHAWDVKFNLDVASRLLRDLPEAERGGPGGQPPPSGYGPICPACRRVSHEPRPPSRSAALAALACLGSRAGGLAMPRFS